LAEEPDRAGAGHESAGARPLRRGGPRHPVSQVDTLKGALQAAGKTFEIKVYPGAPHGFHADYRASYRQDAAEDAWNQMIAWFKKYKVLA
jgi:dienelactone hydrolase